MAGFARPDLIATTEWLAGSLGRPDLRVLDVRWRTDGSGAALHGVGHIPGAVHIDWRASLARVSDAGTSFLLAEPGPMAEALAAAGVGDATSVVVYDDTQGYYASWVWWGLRAHGHADVRVLEGGWPAWAAAGHPVSTGAAGPGPAAAAFRPSAQARMRVSLADVRAMLGSSEAQLVDARGPAEFQGLEGEASRLGHIPGAVNVPAAALQRPGTQLLRDPDELQGILLRANLTRNRRIVCYDASGLAATRLAFVLTLLGHDDVAVYEGGWSEWGERFDLLLGR